MSALFGNEAISLILKSTKNIAVCVKLCVHCTLTMCLETNGAVTLLKIAVYYKRCAFADTSAILTKWHMPWLLQERNITTTKKNVKLLDFYIKRLLANKLFCCKPQLNHYEPRSICPAIKKFYLWTFRTNLIPLQISSRTDLSTGQKIFKENILCLSTQPRDK